MHAVEKKLLSLFDVMNWSALYHPFSLNIDSIFPSAKGGYCFQPSFYVPCVRLFVHYGDDVRHGLESQILQRRVLAVSRWVSETCGGQSSYA
jgi:hypothetical protein